jgi:CubicO group peptidase (beta-lactamase class C family)
VDATFESWVSDLLAEHAVPGVAVGIVQGGSSYLRGFGVASVETGVPVTPHTIFPLCSVTKAYTATVAMILADRGDIDLDTSVRRYLPNFAMSDRGVTERCTVRNLLTHTGGFRGDRGDSVLAKAVLRFVELPQLTPLGQLWAYSNAGFVVLGRIIEVVCGQPYEEAIRELILDPLGMEQTFFFADQAIGYPVANGHHAGPGGQQVDRVWKDGRLAHPFAGLVSTMRDQVKYLRFHLGRGPSLMSTAALGSMTELQIEAGNVCDAMGLGLMLLRRGDAILAGHGGSGHGLETLLFFVPGHDFGICVLTNGYRVGWRCTGR